MVVMIVGVIVFHSADYSGTIAVIKLSACIIGPKGK
jgi:hypothetical protein